MRKNNFLLLFIDSLSLSLPLPLERYFTYSKSCHFIQNVVFLQISNENLCSTHRADSVRGGRSDADREQIKCGYHSMMVVCVFCGACVVFCFSRVGCRCNVAFQCLVMWHNHRTTLNRQIFLQLAMKSWLSNSLERSRESFQSKHLLKSAFFKKKGKEGKRKKKLDKVGKKGKKVDFILKAQCRYIFGRISSFFFSCKWSLYPRFEPIEHADFM